MGVNSSKSENFEELMDDSNNDNNSGLRTNDPPNQLIEAIDISEDSDEEDSNLEISNKSVSTTRKNSNNSQPIFVPEDVDQSFFTDDPMYPDADSSKTSPARLKSLKNASECIRIACESRNSPDNDLELSTIESASIDDLTDTSLFDILDEDFELRVPMDQQLLKRKVSPGRNSCEPVLKKQKVVDDKKEADADVDAEMERMIQVEREKMKALEKRLREENRLKWMGSYREAIYEEVGDEGDQYLHWVESEPREPPRYLNILLQALEAQADARCRKRTVGPEEMAVEKQRKELEVDEPISADSDGRNDDEDDDVLQKRKKAANGQALERNSGSDLWGSSERSFVSSNDEELQKLSDTWETGTFSSVESTDSESGARADFIRKLRENTMSFLNAPYFLPSDVSREMEVDEEVEDESRSTHRSDADIFADEEEENGKGVDDDESMISDDISVDEGKEDEKEVEEDAVDEDEEGEETDNEPEKGGTPVDEPGEGGVPVDEDEEFEKAANEPKKGGAPVAEPVKGGTPVAEHKQIVEAADKDKEGAEAAASAVPSPVETDLTLNKQRSTESVIILESQEVIDVPSSSDDESQPDEPPVLPEDEVNAADFLETSMVEEGERLNVIPPEVLVNPFFSKKRKEKTSTEVTTANTSISTFQLPDAFDMKYLEITITPMASNDPDSPQMSDAIKIWAENSDRPKVTKRKETKSLRAPIKVKITRDQKLSHRNKVNVEGKCATKGKKNNVPRKEIVEIDLGDSDD